MDVVGSVNVGRSSAALLDVELAKVWVTSSAGIIDAEAAVVTDVRSSKVVSEERMIVSALLDTADTEGSCSMLVLESRARFAGVGDPTATMLDSASVSDVALIAVVVEVVGSSDESAVVDNSSVFCVAYPEIE